MGFWATYGFKPCRTPKKVHLRNQKLFDQESPVNIHYMNDYLWLIHGKTMADESLENHLLVSMINVLNGISCCYT